MTKSVKLVDLASWTGSAVSLEQAVMVELATEQIALDELVA